MSSVVEVTVKSQEGTCAFGHKVGDKIVFDGKSVKGDICYSALIFCFLKFMLCVMVQSFHGPKIKT